MKPAAAARRDRTLTIQNRQRTVRVDRRRFRRLATALLSEVLALPRYDLGLCLLADAEMIQLNETFLRHAGSTDVITFDYVAAGPQPGQAGHSARQENSGTESPLHGEIFICLDEAIRQAKRFRTSWQSELVRYLVHGVLHLRGFDDCSATARRRMKREENRLVRALASRGSFRRLAKPD